MINLSAEHVALTVLPLDLRGQRRNCFTCTGLVLIPVKPPELDLCKGATACHRRLHLICHNALLKRSVRTIPINPSLTWDSPVRNFNNLSCPRIKISAHKAIVLLHDFFVTFGSLHHIALFRFFAIASEVLHASLHSLDSQCRHHCVRTPASSSSLRPTLATAHLTQRSNDIVLRNLICTSRLGRNIQPIQTQSEHPTLFSLARNTAPEFDPTL